MIPPIAIIAASPLHTCLAITSPVFRRFSPVSQNQQSPQHNQCQKRWSRRRRRTDQTIIATIRKVLAIAAIATPEMDARVRFKFVTIAKPLMQTGFVPYYNTPGRFTPLTEYRSKNRPAHAPSLQS